MFARPCPLITSEMKEPYINSGNKKPLLAGNKKALLETPEAIC